MKVLWLAACLVLVVQDASAALATGHETLTYSVDGVNTGAFARFPDMSGVPAGVLVLWHGTVLRPGFGTVEQAYNNDDAFKTSDLDDIIVVMPHQLGLGATWGTQKQKWQQLKAIQSEGTALLTHVYDKAKTKYSLADGAVLRLFMFGHSQGGTSSLAYHFYYQAASDIMKKYDLKVTVASAGHYSAAVWEASAFKPYADYATDASMQASYSANLLPVSKKMQNVLLCHLLHTYKSSLGPSHQDIEYAAGYENDLSTAGDSWTQMFKMINLVMPDQGAVTSVPVETISGYDSRPPFLTATSWQKLTDAGSAIRIALNNYLVENSLVEAFADIFDSNFRDVAVFYACNDLNVPCKHGAMLPTGNRITHHDVTPTGNAITSLSDRHTLSSVKAWEHFLAEVKSAKTEVAAAPSATGSCGSTDADLVPICNVPGGVCHSFCVKSDAASTSCDYRGSYIKSTVSFHDAAIAAQAAGGDISAVKTYRLAPPAFANLPDNCDSPDFYTAVDGAASQFLGSSKHVAFELDETCSLSAGSSACDPLLPRVLVAESATSTTGKSKLTGQVLSFDDNSVIHQFNYMGTRGADQVLTYQVFARDTLLEKLKFGGGAQPKVCIQPNCKSKAVKAGQFKFTVGTIFGQGSALTSATSVRLNFKISLANGVASAGDTMTTPTAAADPYRFTFTVGSTTFSVDFAKSFLFGAYADVDVDFKNPSTGQASLSFTADSTGLGATVHVDLAIDDAYKALCGSTKCMMLYDPDVVIDTPDRRDVSAASASRLMGALLGLLLAATVYMPA